MVLPCIRYVGSCTVESLAFSSGMVCDTLAAPFSDIVICVIKYRSVMKLDVGT